MSDRRPEKFCSRWTMTLGVVAVSGAAAVTWTQAEENVVRPETSGSNAGEVWVASTEFKFVPATVRVIAGRSVTLVLDNSQAETENGINVPTFGLYLIARGGQVTRKTLIFDKPGNYEFMWVRLACPSLCPAIFPISVRAGRVLGAGLGRHFSISISVGQRPVRLQTETGSQGTLGESGGRRHEVHSFGRLFGRHTMRFLSGKASAGNDR